MNDTCYLCGFEILTGNATEDHIVPKQFIKRLQPKVKGFDYAGVLPSHGSCNNQFGPEVYSQKALAVIKALHDENCFLKRQHQDNPALQIMALNSECFPGFTKRDLELLKIIDVRDKDYEDWSNQAFFRDKKKNKCQKGRFVCRAGGFIKERGCSIGFTVSKFSPDELAHISYPVHWRHYS